MNDEFLSLLSKTDIKKLNNYEILDDKITFKYLIGLLSNDDIYMILTNYIIFDHVIGTYIYIQLIKQNFDTNVKLINLIQYKDKENIFCREILEKYKDKNESINILLSHIFNLSKKNIFKLKYDNIIKYRNRRYRVFPVGTNEPIGSNGPMGPMGPIGSIGPMGSNGPMGFNANAPTIQYNTNKLCRECTELGLYK